MTTHSISRGDELDFAFSWRGELPGPWLETGENITAQTPSVTGPIRVISSSIQGDDVIVWITPTSGAQIGQRARLTVQIETSATRVKSVTMDFVIER